MKFCLSADANLTELLLSTPQSCIDSVHSFVFLQRKSAISAAPLSPRWKFLMFVSLISELSCNMVTIVARFPSISFQRSSCMKDVPSIPRGVELIGGTDGGTTEVVVDVGRVGSRRNR